VEPLTRGLPPLDPRSNCPLSSTEIAELPPPPKKKKIRGCATASNRLTPTAQTKRLIDIRIMVHVRHIGDNLFYLHNHLFEFGATAVSGPWTSLFTRSLDNTRQTTVGRTLLDEYFNSSQRHLPDNAQQTNNHAPAGIRTHNPSRQAAADLHFRPWGHWDRLCNNIGTLLQFFFYNSCHKYHLAPSTKSINR
jgi:hypothetical protein